MPLPSDIKVIGAGAWISADLAEFKAKNKNETITLSDEEQYKSAELGWQRENVVILSDHIEQLYKELHLQEMKILKLKAVIDHLSDKEMEA